MHVIATAGHVDHGKSSLVRALTGTDPDRLVEERQRGLTIELGYCWTTLGDAGEVAFVDVPGHERFLPTMLSGVGPVPAVLLAVAADDPWLPQAAEHLAALDAFGVRHGVVAVTRCDLAEATPMVEEVRRRLAGTTLADAPTVEVSARTGRGLDELRHRLADMVSALPAPSVSAPVRLWVDRRFGVQGVGLVVTGTLGAGSLTVGDALVPGPRSAAWSHRGARDAAADPAALYDLAAAEMRREHADTVRVRGVETLGRSTSSVAGVARVALNVTGPGEQSVVRGGVLVTPGRWLFTDVVDVSVRAQSFPPVAEQGAALPEQGAHPPGSSPGARLASLPEQVILHIGAAAVPARCRPLASGVARIHLTAALPLRIGDAAVVREPGSRRLWGVTVLDPLPPPLRRRGDAVRRAATLRDVPAPAELSSEVARRGLARLSVLERVGVDLAQADAQADAEANADAVLRGGDWAVSDARAGELRSALERAVSERVREGKVDGGLPLASAARALGVSDAALMARIAERSDLLQVSGGRICMRGPAGVANDVEGAVLSLAERLRDGPFEAPTAAGLLELGLTPGIVSAAARARLLLHLGGGIVLMPDADAEAVQRLTSLEQPFTVSQARAALGTSRRVVLPLLAHLDRRGLTRRLPDDRRVVAKRE